MNHFISGVCIAASMIVTGCSSVALDVNQPGNILPPSKMLQPPYSSHDSLTVTANGFIWESCESVINAAVDDTQGILAERGATHLIDATWSKESAFTRGERPFCNTRWYSGLFFGVGLASPWSRSVSVSGTVVNKDQVPVSSAASTHPDAMYPEAAVPSRKVLESTGIAKAKRQPDSLSQAGSQHLQHEESAPSTAPFTEMFYWSEDLRE